MRAGIALASVLLAGSLMAMGAAVQCPGKTTFVHIGDSLDTVVQTCGKPKRFYEKRVASPQSPEQVAADKAKQINWYYRTSDYNDSGFYGVTTSNNGVVTFSTDGKVIRLSTGNTMRCRQGSVSVGATMAQVEQACGAPQIRLTNAQLNQANTSGYPNGVNSGIFGRAAASNRDSDFDLSQRVINQPKAVSTTTTSKPVKGTVAVLIYQPNSYAPAMGFMFFNGVLRHTGPASRQR